jgi:hypothetical protein
MPLSFAALVQHIGIETFSYDMRDPNAADLLLDNMLPVLRLANKNIRIKYMTCVGCLLHHKTVRVL